MATMKKIQTGETIHAWAFGEGNDAQNNPTGIGIGVFDHKEHLTKGCVWIESISADKKRILIDPERAAEQGFEIVIMPEAKALKNLA